MQSHRLRHLPVRRLQQSAFRNRYSAGSVGRHSPDYGKLRDEIRYGFADGTLVICFCGRLGQEKSIDVLLDIFAAHHRSDGRSKLMVIGTGPMEDALKGQAVRLGLGDSVVFTGAVPHNQIRELYACCDLYATTARSEVNSISMLEAMSMGLPVLHIVDEENLGQIQEEVNGLSFRTAGKFHRAVQSLENDPDA